jgi:molybdenum cofactor biosynthesis enzyme MoaA
MTETYEQPAEINWRNFATACKLADKCGATTALITGKGEPTLHLEQVERYIIELSMFPLVELQTNGILPARGAKVGWRRWHVLGLNTVAISVVHFEQKRNAEIYGGKHYDLSEFIKELHDAGLSVRLTVMMLKGYIDSAEEVRKLLNFAREYKVEQVTVRNIEVSKNLDDHTDPIFRWVNEYRLSYDEEKEIEKWLCFNHTKVLELPFGAQVFDVYGQNLCLSNCLTVNEQPDTLRHLIFFPDGHLRYAWQYPGAILL